MVVNDNAGEQDERGALESIASKPGSGLKELARFLQVPLISP
jgi:hypothetical protein